MRRWWVAEVMSAGGTDGAGEAAAAGPGWERAAWCFGGRVAVFAMVDGCEAAEVVPRGWRVWAGLRGGARPAKRKARSCGECGNGGRVGAAVQCGRCSGGRLAGNGGPRWSRGG